MTSNLKHQINRKENKERRKTSFLKEQLENADLYNSVLNKYMTTRE